MKSVETNGKQRKPPPAFTFTAATLPLTGTAADGGGVQSVAWANDRGGSGPATGTTAWSAAIRS